MNEVVLKEYLVTVYTVDTLSRKGAYTLYGKSYNSVLEKVNTRLNTNETFTVTYKGESSLVDWSDEY